MFWIAAILFALSLLVFRGAGDAWLRRRDGPGSKPAGCGMTSHEVARLLLEKSGHPEITVARARRSADSHHDPSGRRLLLDQDTYPEKSIAAVALAATLAAEASADANDRPAIASRRFVTRFLHPMLGVAMLAGIGLVVWRAALWKMLFFTWVGGNALLLVCHAMTLAIEYKLAARGMRMLESAGLLRESERADFESVAKGLPLRHFHSVGAALARILKALLPAKGW